MSWTSDSRRDELLQAWLDGEISPSEQQELSELRAGDPQLDREARLLEEQARLLREAPVEDPPPELAASIMQQVGQTRPPGRLYSFLFRPRTLTYRLITGFTAAAAVVALVFLVHEMATRPDHDASMHASSAGDEDTVPASDGEIVSAAQDALVIELALGAARDVELVGDFNDWGEEGLDLVDEDGDGVWTLVLPLPEPGRYSYRIRVDGDTWVADPGADAQVDDGFGGVDSVRYVL